MSDSATVMTAPYIGRFAPSPTGPLHFGSLVCALASYLDAKVHAGQWLVRIEDIDPPRECIGASEAIISALLGHGLQWDGELVYQSHRIERYRQAQRQLLQQNLVYPCACSRQRVAGLVHGYDGHCLRHPPQGEKPVAMKLKCQDFQFSFCDGVLLEQQQQLQAPRDDFVIWRKDGLVAYQLAVVVDDIAQGITHVVRGSDLFTSTVRQALLWRLLGHVPPAFAHLPVVENDRGQKLSKQNHAAALDLNTPAENLYHALQFLRQQPPAQLPTWSVERVLTWACEHWNISSVPKQDGCYYAF